MAKTSQWCRRATFVLLTLLMASACLYLTGCEHRSQDESAHASPSGPVPEQESWNVQFNVQEGEHPRLRIAAGHMSKYEAEDSTYTLLYPHPDSSGDQVRIDLFDDSGDSLAVVEADRVVYLDDENRFEAGGEVVVHTIESKRLETELLQWNEADRSIYAPGFVRITSPAERLQGYELTGDEGLRNYELARVTGQVTPDE